MEFNKFFDTETLAKAWDLDGVWKEQERSLKALQKANKVWAEALNKAADRQLALTREAVEDSVATARELSQAKGVEDVMNRQSAAWQRWSEKTTSGAREVAELLGEAQAEAAKIVSEQAKQSASAFQAEVTKTASAAAKGSKTAQK